MNENKIPNFWRLTIYTIFYVSIWWFVYSMLPVYGKFFMLMWYGGLLFQSTFCHEYAAHSTMTMSPFVEKLFYIGTWITQGSSYLSAYAYGILHRIHHDHVDTEHDPHSPRFDKNQWAMMVRTAKGYSGIFERQEYEGKPVSPKYMKNLPNWHAFDRFAHSWFSRVMWIAIYISVYLYIGITHNISEIEWGISILLCIGSCLMSPIHGLIINWYGHVWGYRNYNTHDWSRNIGTVGLSFVMTFLMMGEDLHNNHHAKPSSPNFATKWWEYDFKYVVLLLADQIGFIRLKRY